VEKMPRVIEHEPADRSGAAEAAGNRLGFEHDVGNVTQEMSGRESGESAAEDDDHSDMSMVFSQAARPNATTATSPKIHAATVNDAALIATAAAPSRRVATYEPSTVWRVVSLHFLNRKAT
jgi:hypothetical protein